METKSILRVIFELNLVFIIQIDYIESMKTNNWSLAATYDALTKEECVRILDSKPYNPKLPHGGNFICQFPKSREKQAERIVTFVNDYPYIVKALQVAISIIEESNIKPKNSDEWNGCKVALTVGLSHCKYV